MKNDLSSSEMTGALVSAFGGAENIEGVDACLTRLRVSVKNLDNIDNSKVKELGAVAVVIVGQVAQAIFGSKSRQYKDNMQDWISK